MKEVKERFILELPLKTQKYQEDVLDKRLEICRRIYNQLVAKTKKQHQEMVKTSRYRTIKEELERIQAEKSAEDKISKRRSKREKELYQMLNDLYKEYGFTDFSMRSAAGKQREPFKKNIDSSSAQKIGVRLWTSWEKYLYGNGENVYFCKYGNYNSVEGATNTSGIRFKMDALSKKDTWRDRMPYALFWNGLEIPVIVKTQYEKDALQNEIAFPRIVRKTIRGKKKYYLQLVLKGTPPVKYNPETGELKHPIGEGTVGIDMGTQILAAASEENLKFVVLADRVKTCDIAKQKKELQQKMDRSRRAMNPQNYNADGTIKKQGAKKVYWVKSKHYLKMQEQVKELERKQAAIRKYQHTLLVNELLCMGNTFYVVKKDYKGMQQKKELEQKEDGSYKNRKNHGSAIQEKAPAMFLSLLEQKVRQSKGTFIKVVPTTSFNPTQYSHIDGKCTKKAESNRYDALSGCQKNLYVAFLLMNMGENGLVDDMKCVASFEQFKFMHDNLMEQLHEEKQSGTYFPISMGIL